MRVWDLCLELMDLWFAVCVGWVKGAQLTLKVLGVIVGCVVGVDGSVCYWDIWLGVIRGSVVGGHGRLL